MIAARVVNSFWALSARPAAAAFERALRRPEEAQASIVAGVVAANTSSAYGKLHRFSSITTVDEFRRQVPLTSYEHYTPFIERIRAGEQNVLTIAPVTRLVPSSGSSAARKLIPYTGALHEEFQRGILPWIADLFRSTPELARGSAYWSVSPSIEEDESSAVPIGFEDDSHYLSPLLRTLISKIQAVPSVVRHIQDGDRFRFATLLFLLRRRDLRIISVWHPSFLTLLCRALVDRWEELLRSLTDGCSVTELPIRERAILAKRNRELAAALAKCDPQRPQTIWPRLGQISCWADGQAGGALRELRRYFPDVPIVPKGVIATEAFVSLPYRAQHPLAVQSHFLEFLDDAGNVFGVHELERDGEYSVVVTTGGGLYRYQFHDRVRVDGFVHATPSIRFLGKEDRTSDLVGEKLNEAFVAAVLERVFAVAPDFMLLAPEETESGWRYTLFIRAASPLPPDLSSEIDRHLRANPHYDLARRLGQLDPLALCDVDAGAHERYLTQLASSGTPLGGIKATCLSRDTNWRTLLTSVHAARTRVRTGAL